MVATNLKAETISLMDKRASIEVEMGAIVDQLCGPGRPGISGNLVDSEGFPRSDIDIPQVRAQRARLAELRIDFQVITSKIEKNLEVLHSARLAKVAPVFPKGSDASTSIEGDTSQVYPMDEDLVVRIPFAVIDEITDDSPAAADGLQLGDHIIKFGSVEVGDDLIRRLASEAQLNQDHPIPLVIMRQGSTMNLFITPRQWFGRGLLGCHFRIL
ncbi:26S proteasome non-ATPase regulatory subunit 9 [Iris pallida]|uniref:26S proteasome non-ATPase regulatory subunit 9 n=1 Tax=Iris pallida TaxID=29817 RepID=A0AAX6G823_IRIPA|nr:26S proteasome non-ATPase regulatory subunit 9 [Iris pallida]